MAGLLAGQPFSSELTGDASLRSRPMGRVIDPLTQMGASIASADGGRPPLRIAGGQCLRGIDYTLPMASAQVKSCVLLAGLYAQGSTAVTEPAPTRDHTERMLTYCAFYDNGFSNPEDVKRNSRRPSNSAPCTPIACVAGSVGSRCYTDSQCDSVPGAGDGECDACSVGFGVSTDDEMFVLTGSYVVGP